jgi:hypothetical protein
MEVLKCVGPRIGLPQAVPWFVYTVTLTLSMNLFYNTQQAQRFYWKYESAIGWIL